MKDAIQSIQQAMLAHLNNSQMKQLSLTLECVLGRYDITLKDGSAMPITGPANTELMGSFLSAKRLEGCSEKTIRYYRSTITRMLSTTDAHLTHMRTEDIRRYLSDYEQTSRCSKASIDNIRRILSSLFSWLEDEDYILIFQIKCNVFE